MWFIDTMAGVFSAIKNKVMPFVGEKMDATGDNYIKQVKPVSERQTSSFISFVVPTFFTVP